MKRVAFALFSTVLLSLTAAPHAAQAAPTNASGTVTFESITAVDLDGGTGPANDRALAFEGTLVGDTTPREIRFVFFNTEFANRCHQHALKMLEEPGLYTLELRTNVPTQYTGCKLKRR